MASPFDAIAPELEAAIVDAFGEEYRGTDPVLRPSQFSDVQANCALPMARLLRRSPRRVAEAIAATLEARGIGAVAAVEVSGPGYLNFTFTEGWLAQSVELLARDVRLGVPTVPVEVIPIDYSAPNVAKEMHVGHLRTTVVGDCLARVLEHLGHTVIRQNHIGDWGTPFGMLIEHLLDVGDSSEEAGALRSDPNVFYQAARRKFDADPAFADRARRRVVRLQSEDPDTLAIWRELIELSKAYFNRVYSTLGVTLTDEHLAGESTYKDDLQQVCNELEQRGIARMSDGALCVFLPDYLGRDGSPMPLIVRKSDGGYSYATTDLATVRHRVRELGADRLLYVVGATQSLHLQMVWATARLAGWLPDHITPVHVQIGSVLGPDHKILKTRSGASLRLLALLDEAIGRAAAVLASDRPSLEPADRDRLAPEIGIGAVKHADLSVAHDTDYVFDLDRMMSFTGNTGPYLQYAATRIRSIFRNAGHNPEVTRRTGGTVEISNADEHRLALELLTFGETVTDVGQAYQPHKLCGYLNQLAQTFSRFYESSPVLAAPTPELRRSRLLLAATALAVLSQGLDLLGIAVPDQM